METKTPETTDVSVNLDALAAPDNGGPANVDLESKIANLPNLDEELDNQNNQSQNNVQNQSQAAPGNNEPGQNGASQSKYIDLLKKKYEDNGLEVPSDLNEENVFDKMEEFYSSSVKNKTSLHPEVEKFQKAVEAGVNPDDYFKTLRGIDEVLNMPAKDLVRISLEQNFGKSENRPNGWDSDKIKATIEKMENSGYLDIEAEKIRSSYEQSKSQASEQMIRQAETQRQAEMQQRNTLREQSIKESLSYFNQLDNINGLQLSQSEKAEFAENFRYLVTPDDKSGTSPLLDMLQSDENLVKVAYFLSKGDAKIKEQITRSKESTKNDFMNKLDPEPKITQKRSGMQSTEIDFDALAAPANL